MAATRRLLDFGLSNLPANTFVGRSQARVRLFEEIMTRYPRRPPRSIRENAGLAFQAMAYGFIAADRGRLEIIATGVRTGSARQLRSGDIDDAARGSLMESGVIAITEAELLKTVRTWDWPKQDAAVHGMLHYLAHIEQNVQAVQRLLAFIAETDPSHDSLVSFQTEEPPQSSDDASEG